MNTSKKLWRQVMFWGLSFNVCLGFPALLATYLFAATDPSFANLTTAFMALLAAGCTAAGIRQWGKKTGVES